MQPQGKQGIPVLIDLVKLPGDVSQLGAVVLDLGFHLGAYDPLEPVQHLSVLDFQLVEQGKHLPIEFSAGGALTRVVALVVVGTAVVLISPSGFVFGFAEDRLSAMTADDHTVAIDRIVPVVGLVAEEHLNSIESHEVDDRFVLPFHPLPAKLHFPDVRPVRQDPVQLAPHEVGMLFAVYATLVLHRFYKAVEAVLMVGVQIEYAAHIVGLRVVDADETTAILAVILVAIGRAAGKETAPDAALNAFLRSDRKLIAVKLADGGEHIGIEFSRRCFVERLGDADDLDAVLVAEIDEIDPVLHIAGGTVHFVKQQTVHPLLIFSGVIKHFMKCFSLLALVRGLGDTVHFCDGRVVPRRPFAQGVLLDVEAVAVLLFLRGYAGKGEVIFHACLSSRAA